MNATATSSQSMKNSDMKNSDMKNSDMKTNDGDSQSLAGQERSSYFEQLDEIQDGGAEHDTNEIAFALCQTKIEGMITLRFEKDQVWGNLFPSDLNDDTKRMKHVTKTFIRFFQGLYNLNESSMHWISTIEFESSGVANCHILFNFLPAVINGHKALNLDDLQKDAELFLDMTCISCGNRRDQINVHWVPATGGYWLIDFVTKANLESITMHLDWSSDPDYWLRPHMVNCDYVDLSAELKNIYDLHKESDAA
jgi:hypothetical protein